MTDARAGAAENGIFDEDDSDLAENQEFDRALSSGNELLAQGNAADARAALEKALRYKPRNQRARNLLGLSLFKLGELARAEEIYRSLIEDHPADPTLRVNLGLVFLKANASPDAVRCFETALDLAPDHEKAQNYLGLALAQKGELGRAREWFLKAGNDAMADRMSQALQQSPIREVAKDADAALAADKPFKPAISEKPPSGKKRDTLEMAKPAGLPDPEQVPTPPVGTRWVATAPGTAVAPPVAPKADGRVVQNVPEPSAPPANSPSEAASEAPSTMAQYTSASRLAMPTEKSGGFAIGPSEVVIYVKGEVLTRLDGLVASWGAVTMRPELKRFRGKATDKPFGDGARRMLRASGEGRFVISREGRQFTALELGDEPAYFREEVLFAFEESILFENGRVPSKGGTDLHLVHLRGRGKLLLATQGMPKAVDVLRGEPLRIPMDQLVGWHGPLIQPRLVPIVEEAPDLGVALELAGEGRALIDVPSGSR
ncbi:MAG: tetratricopeptide repeat protein [Myxococcales bacterium]